MDISSVIDGLTQGRRPPRDVFREFNLLLNSRNDEIGQYIPVLLNNYTFNSPIKKLLRCKLVDRYKFSDEVWKMLMSNDTLYMNQALKFDWFFTNCENPEDFLESVIPRLSYSMRLKIMNRYASLLSNTAAGEIAYKGIKARYGISNAANILPACGERFIRDELGKFNTMLPRQVLMTLLDKYPTLCAEYLEGLLNEEPSRKVINIRHYSCVFIKLSNKDFTTFLRLLDKLEGRGAYFKVGKRKLEKIAKKHFDVLSGRTGIWRCCDNKEFFRRLSFDQVKQLTLQLLPNKLSDLFDLYLCHTISSNLRYLKPSLKSNVFLPAFRMKYGKDCSLENVRFKSENNFNALVLLRCLPVDIRIKWIDAIVPEIVDAGEMAEYIAYLPIEMSIPKLNALMTSQSNHQMRTNIVREMIATIEHNDCPSAIKDVVSCISKRIRNESHTFKRAVLDQFLDLNILYKLDFNEWNCVLDLINVIVHNTVHIYPYQFQNLIESIAHTCYKRNVDPDPYFQKIFQMYQINETELDRYHINTSGHKPFYKNFMVWFLNEIPNMKLKYDDYFIMRLVESVGKYNRTHKRNILVIPDWLTKEIERIVAGTSPPGQIKRLVKALKLNNFDHHDRLLQICLPGSIHCHILNCCLMRNPDTILTNSDVIVKNISKMSFSNYSHFYEQCRLYDSYGIPEMMIKTSLCILESQIEEGMTLSEINTLQKSKSHAVQVLGVLQDASTYLELCSQYRPLKHKVEDYSNEIQIEFAVQRAFCQSLTHVATPLETLSLLPEFTKGDYLKIVYGSLIGVCVKIRENIILSTLEKWVDCPVSLRKHILRLIYKIAPKERSGAMCANMFKSEKNTSLRLVLFLQVRETFISEPTNEHYNAFTDILHQLTDEDQEMLDRIFDIDKIHQEYLSQYLKLIWKLLDTKWMNVLPYAKNTIIDKINKHLFIMLDDDVCDMFLQHEMSFKLPNSTLSKFVSYYLLYGSSDSVRLHRLDTVLAILEPAMRDHWNDCNQSGWAFPIRHVIDDFIETLCAESINKEGKLEAGTLTFMKKKLVSFAPLRDLMKECIQLDVSALYLKFKDDESKYVSAVADLYDDYIQQYESQFGYSLIDHLSREIPMMSKTELAYELLNKHSHPMCHILASIISTTDICEDDQQIIDKLLSSKIPDVQASASQYFKSLQSF